VDRTVFQRRDTQQRLEIRSIEWLATVQAKKSDLNRLPCTEVVCAVCAQEHGSVVGEYSDISLNLVTF